MRTFFTVTICLCANFIPSSAWLPPERCQQVTFSPVPSNDPQDVIHLSANTPDVFNIDEFWKNHVRRLNETYRYHTYDYNPVWGVWDSTNTYKVTLKVPFNCRFRTYNPKIISSVACYPGMNCQLTSTVSTVDSYTSTEGYNWGVKVSFGIGVPEVLSLGAEASVGGTYSCAYTKGKTTTKSVVCSPKPDFKSGYLEVYVVKSDMMCDIGYVILKEDPRDNQLIAKSEDHGLTLEEFNLMYNTAKINLGCEGVSRMCNIKKDWSIRDLIKTFMIDATMLPNSVLRKLKNAFPHFNPATDYIIKDESDVVFKFWLPKRNEIVVRYMKFARYETENTIIMPFTNGLGDSEVQYACVPKPF